MKYQKPIPIKAQDGAQISKQDNTRVVIPQVYAPIKAPEGYQKVYRVTNMPTDNKAMTPAAIALRGAATGSTKGGLVGAGLGAAGALIGHYYKDDINRAVDNSLNLAKLGLLPAYNFLFGTKPMLQTSESTDTNQSAEQSQTQTETNTSTETPPNNEGNNESKEDKQQKESNSSKEKGGDKETRFQRFKRRMGNFYGNALEGAGYTVGIAGPFLGGYGLYKAVTKESPTQADSLLNVQDKEIQELQKYQQIKEKQKIIESLRQGISPTSGTDSISYPTSGSNNNNLDSIADILKASSKRQKSGEYKIYD